MRTPVAASALVALLAAIGGGSLVVAKATTDATRCDGSDPATRGSDFRKDEAVRIVTDLNSRAMNALDKVTQTGGLGDPQFDSNVDFVVTCV
jgi:hypothetical protein